MLTKWLGQTSAEVLKQQVWSKKSPQNTNICKCHENVCQRACKGQGQYIKDRNHYITTLKLANNANGQTKIL